MAGRPANVTPGANCANAWRIWKGCSKDCASPSRTIHAGIGLAAPSTRGCVFPRNTFWIEHIMPQSWETAWAAPTMGTLQDRAQRIHTLGNLTLLTAKLNKAVSNGLWDGENGKRSELRKHDLLLLNRDLNGFSGNGWTDESITRPNR